MTTDTQHRLVILRHAPQSSNTLREGLDAALVAAAFGQPVSLLFMGQGILALTREQGAMAPGIKSMVPTIDMLAMYDIDELLVPTESLAALGLCANDLIDGVTLVPNGEVASWVSRFDSILNF